MYESIRVFACLYVLLTISSAALASSPQGLCKEIESYARNSLETVVNYRIKHKGGAAAAIREIQDLHKRHLHEEQLFIEDYSKKSNENIIKSLKVFSELGSKIWAITACNLRDGKLDENRLLNVLKNLKTAA